MKIIFYSYEDNIFKYSAFSSRENLSIIISSPGIQKEAQTVELGSSHGTVLAIQKK